MTRGRPECAVCEVDRGNKAGANGTHLSPSYLSLGNVFKGEVTLHEITGVAAQNIHAAVLLVLWLGVSIAVIYLAARRKRMLILVALYVWSWLLVLWLGDIPVTSVSEANLLFWITAFDAVINVGCVITFYVLAFRHGWFRRRRG